MSKKLTTGGAILLKKHGSNYFKELVAKRWKKERKANKVKTA